MNRQGRGIGGTELAGGIGGPALLVVRGLSVAPPIATVVLTARANAATITDPADVVCETPRVILEGTPIDP